MENSFKQFLVLRIVGGIALGLIALWGFWIFLGLFQQPEKSPVAETDQSEPAHTGEQADAGLHSVEEAHTTVQASAPAPSVPEESASLEHGEVVEHGEAGEHGVAPEHDALQEPKANGVAFVEATISAMDYELKERFWGWRRNDLIRFTDNVENMQLGVLEVVRRTTVSLAERISRYGVTDSIDKNLENAMHWFMIKPDRYWLPSAEEKYSDGLKELKIYADKLERSEARFYVRADNLIPLLVSLADLVGSCDENLVKAKEEDGSPVSWFKVDDYFYYAKGVATATGKILHAVREDFSSVLEARHGVDLLHHAIHACEVAAELDPWLVTDASLDGVLANHRANMAAPISHARYYLEALAKALST